MSTNNILKNMNLSNSSSSYPTNTIINQSSNLQMIRVSNSKLCQSRSLMRLRLLIVALSSRVNNFHNYRKYNRGLSPLKVTNYNKAFK